MKERSAGIKGISECLRRAEPSSGGFLYSENSSTVDREQGDLHREDRHPTESNTVRGRVGERGAWVTWGVSKVVVTASLS